MAAQRRTSIKRETLKEDKSNPITQKLLGADPNSINYEEIRQNKRKGSVLQLGNQELNEQILKIVSCKFSLDIIFQIDLSNQNLSNIQILETCPNIIILNIEKNQITDLKPLSKLTQIKLLNAAHNQISSVAPLSNIEQLTNLQLQGNLIKNIINLENLKNLKNLKTMYLQTILRYYKNDVCNEEGYRSAVFDIVKSLKRLDGLPKSFNYLPIGKDILPEKNLEFKLNNSVDYWYTQVYPKIEKPLKLEKEENLQKDIRHAKEIMLSCETFLNQFKLT